MKRLVPALVLIASLTGLAACGGHDNSSPTPTPSSLDPSTFASLASTGPGSGPGTGPTSKTTVQPCDFVILKPVGAILGQSLVKHTGTAAKPTCVLTPKKKGGAVFDLNYQWYFKGGLEQAWKTMKGIHGEVSQVRVAEAGDARLVVNHSKKAAYATGFVQNGSLIQVVNGEALPKDADALERATLQLMSQISQGAAKLAS